MTQNVSYASNPEVPRWPRIANRTVHPVGGIDLEQCLNFVSSDGLELSWFYTSFTYPAVFYRKGSRPKLEEALGDLPATGAMARLQHCLRIVNERVVHFTKLGFKGPGNRGLSEEELIESGQGWCNEEARVLVALTQIAGLPSRLVFGTRPNGTGHVTTEVYVDGRWVLVDQTKSYIFTRADGTPVNVLDFKTDPVLWLEVDLAFKERTMRTREEARDKDFWDEMMPHAYHPHPLELFHSTGYCNYFIH